MLHTSATEFSTGVPVRTSFCKPLRRFALFALRVLRFLMCCASSSTITLKVRSR